MFYDNLTVIIPFRNGHATLGRLLDSLPAALPVIVVDDQSDKPFETTRGNVRVIPRESRGYFAGACNTGIANCATDVLILNQDVWLEGTRWLELLEKRGEFAIGGDGVFGHPAHMPHGYCQGTFLWLTRELITALGTVFDEEFFPLWGCTALAQTRACRLGFKALPVHAAEYGMRHERGEKPYGSAIVATLQAEPDKAPLFVRTPPLISVIITCYNYGRFLRDAVNSLIGGQTALGEMPPQTLQAFEIVIVDDASTDDTRAIGEKLADPWQGIHFVHLAQNVGSAAAANAGILRSHGKWIAMLDADDMMESTRLEKLYRTAVQNPHRVIYDDALEFAKDALTLKNAHPQGRQSEIVRRGDYYAVPFPMKSYDFERILEQNGIHKGILFERAAWKEIGGYPEEFVSGREDWAINVALGAKGYCGVRVPEPLYLRRQHGGNRHLDNGTREWRTHFIAQMHARFPNLYAGDRPTMCCGNKSKSNGNGNGNNARSMVGTLSAGNGRFSMAQSKTLPGQNGFVMVEYLPGHSGSKAFVGAVSGAQYVFGGKRKTGYVDPRDLPALLQVRDGIHDAFRELKPLAPQTLTNEPSTTAGSAERLLDMWNGDPSAPDLFSGLGELIPKDALTGGETPKATAADLAEIVAPRENTKAKPARKSATAKKPAKAK